MTLKLEIESSSPIQAIVEDKAERESNSEGNFELRFQRHADPKEYAVDNAPLSVRGTLRCARYIDSFFVGECLSFQGDGVLRIQPAHNGILRCDQTAYLEYAWLKKRIQEFGVKNVVVSKPVQMDLLRTIKDKEFLDPEKTLWTEESRPLRVLIENNVPKEFAYQVWVASPQDLEALEQSTGLKDLAKLKEESHPSPQDLGLPIMEFIELINEALKNEELSLIKPGDKVIQLLVTHELTLGGIFTLARPDEKPPIHVDFLETVGAHIGIPGDGIKFTFPDKTITIPENTYSPYKNLEKTPI